MDVSMAVVLLIILAPLVAVVALLIAVTSRGPVFFRQERCGLNGEPFEVLKFRTMTVDAEARVDEARQLLAERRLSIVDAPAFKSPHDPRVTAVGRVLRRFSLDELPQLLNITRGDMSLVGPRPLVMAEAAALQPAARVRHAVKPGLTCIWQTSGRSRIPFDRRMEMDIEYVERRSLALDVVLLLKTPVAALSADGAY